jgi:hypothetical protein
MALKYINIFQSKALQNLPKLGFLVWKETIWQPWSSGPSQSFEYLPTWQQLSKEFKEDSAAGLPDGIFSNQKIPIWVNFGGSCNGRCWYILWPFSLFNCHFAHIFRGHLVYFMVIGIFSLILVWCKKTNLATLLRGFFSAEFPGRMILQNKLCGIFQFRQLIKGKFQWNFPRKVSAKVSRENGTKNRPRSFSSRGLGRPIQVPPAFTNRPFLKLKKKFHVCRYIASQSSVPSRSSRALGFKSSSSPELATWKS